MGKEIEYPRNVHKVGNVRDCRLVSDAKELKQATKEGYVLNPIDALTPEEIAAVRAAREAANEDTWDLPK